MKFKRIPDRFDMELAFSIRKQMLTKTTTKSGYSSYLSPISHIFRNRIRTLKYEAILKFSKITRQPSLNATVYILENIIETTLPGLIAKHTPTTLGARKMHKDLKL